MSDGQSYSTMSPGNPDQDRSSRTVTGGVGSPDLLGDPLDEQIAWKPLLPQ